MNTFGHFFRVTTFGESHGKSIGAVIDGCPSNLEISVDEIQAEVDKRKPLNGVISTSRSEEDKVEIFSGIFENRTLGTPIAMVVYNKDVRSSDYEELKFKIRPGHADYTWREKFGYIDHRGGGRSSARETVVRVAAGAVARKLLKTRGIEIFAYTSNIAGVASKITYYGGGFDLSKIDVYRKNVESNPLRCIDVASASLMEEKIIDAKKNLDSVGGMIEVLALNVPAGLGEPVFNKLSAGLAGALMSIPGVKGVEIGRGFDFAEMRGSEANDFFIAEGNKILTVTNNCGGVLGGLSNGMPIFARVVVKPTSSIGKTQKTVEIKNIENTGVDVHNSELSLKGRHDTCIVPRAVPVVEAMVALTIADFALMQGIIKRRV